MLLHRHQSNNSDSSAPVADIHLPFLARTQVYSDGKCPVLKLYLADTFTAKWAHATKCWQIKRKRPYLCDFWEINIRQVPTLAFSLPHRPLPP